jgi:hypothetical protein
MITFGADVPATARTQKDADRLAYLPGNSVPRFMISTYPA